MRDDGQHRTGRLAARVSGRASGSGHGAEPEARAVCPAAAAAPPDCLRRRSATRDEPYAQNKATETVARSLEYGSGSREAERPGGRVSGQCAAAASLAPPPVRSEMRVGIGPRETSVVVPCPGAPRRKGACACPCELPCVCVTVSRDHCRRLHRTSTLVTVLEGAVRFITVPRPASQIANFKTRSPRSLIRSGSHLSSNAYVSGKTI